MDGAADGLGGEVVGEEGKGDEGAADGEAGLEIQVAGDEREAVLGHQGTIKPRGGVRAEAKRQTISVIQGSLTLLWAAARVDLTTRSAADPHKSATARRQVARCALSRGTARWQRC